MARLRSPLLALLLLPGALACLSPISTVVHTLEKPPKGAGITLIVGPPHYFSAEHKISFALKRAGYQIFSAEEAAAATGATIKAADLRAEKLKALRTLKTPYLCQMRTFGLTSDNHDWRDPPPSATSPCGW